LINIAGLLNPIKSVNETEENDQNLTQT